MEDKQKIGEGDTKTILITQIQLDLESKFIQNLIIVVIGTISIQKMVFLKSINIL